MNNDISEKIKHLSELDFPPGLHGKIMKHVAFLQFRTPFLVVVFLLVLNLVVSGWQIWIKLTETEAFGILKTLVSGIDWSFNSVIDVTRTFNDIFPLSLLLTFAANLLLVAYLIFIMRSFKKLSTKNVEMT